VPKVSELRARFPDKDIEVDGGVGPKTIGACADAGTLIRRKPRGRNLIYPLSHPKGATSLWLERLSSGRRIRKNVITTLKSTVNQAQDKIASRA
jgi:ribulose-phosphate 3-epimerase